MTTSNNPTPDIDWLTRTRWVMYGAASQLVESIQDSQKGQENWQKLSVNWDWDALVAELAAKGEVTEGEARRYVEQMIAQQQQSKDPTENVTATEPTSPGAAPPMAVSVTLDPPVSPESVTTDDIADLLELTRQIETLRLELERRRVDSSQS